MMKKLVVVVCLLLVQINTFSQRKPPAIFVDKGACPFECCTYRKWKTEKTTVAYARPDVRSQKIGKFLKGTNVNALTGEVRTAATRFTVTKEHEKYKPGDVLWVYTYLGEGFSKIWFKGKIYEEDLAFSPYGGSSGKLCETSPECWGRLDKELKMTWWVKIRSPKGWTGWTNQPENFSGADQCG
jgi:hypothetical protein